MKRLLLLLLILAAPAQAGLTRAELDTAVARPPADARLPATLGFVDQTGRRTTLPQVADGKPLVLLFADYTCRHLCGPGLALTGGALADSGLRAGADYHLAVIGLDPRDGASDAQAMAAQLGAGAVRRDVRLLRGDAASTAAAMKALGYRAVYDAASDQFAHDAAVYVFAPDGRLAALLPELGLRPETLRAAIGAPAPQEPLGVGQQIAHLCWGLGAAQGRYARPVVVTLQAISALALAATAVLVWRRRRAA